jgi:hypothetical protein
VNSSVQNARDEQNDERCQVDEDERRERRRQLAKRRRLTVPVSPGAEAATFG